MKPRGLGVLLALGLLAGCSSDATPAGDSGESPGSGTLPVETAPPCEELPEQPAAPGAEALPSLTLPCLGPGPDISLDRLTGRPTLVNLWATWCLPCREEMPLLQETYARHGQDVRFLGIDTQDDPEAAAAFLSDLGIGYPHAVDADAELLRELGVRGLPVTLAVDEQGRVVDRRVGQLTPEELQELIDTLLA
ncbi:TlpA family protein disulfide reductase [Blastococcus saxobsidens]|uniref:Thiol-disulfide isomerase-like thioredoxin n=1 Tax=Blastococcus saxobsidens (strain DD2) TaxID=1146883 RepID=H6RQ57_BLASD|nr:TlpA disulfide reductase family protein [Blastococcus saxobsidens]CCG02826.1 Thiol-disulfide isomerase-like thioredoxin [Blastococcus saxobsidens DD2]